MLWDTYEPLLLVRSALESVFFHRPVFFYFFFKLLVFRKGKFPKTLAKTTFLGENLTVFANMYYSYGPSRIRRNLRLGMPPTP